MRKKTNIIDSIHFILKFFTIISLIGIGIGILGVIVTSCLNNSVFNKFIYRMKLSDVILYFNLPVITESFVKAQILLEILRAISIALIAFMICLMLSKIINNVKKKEIFSILNIKYIRIIGIMIVLLSFIPNLWNFGIDLFIIEVAGGNQALAINGIDNVKIDNNIVEIVVMFIGILTILLGEVFRRGKFLQDEYDATL